MWFYMPSKEELRIKGEEYFAVATPGFVWSGSIHPSRVVSILARDRLQSGRGSTLVKVNSFFTIANASGPEIDQGATLRWLAEGLQRS
jgi:uncharacterized protein DUF6544